MEDADGFAQNIVAAMIQASKATVITEFHQQSIEVRNLEIEYYLTVFDKLSNISGLLAGFATSTIWVEVPKETSPVLITLFLLATSCALGANLLVVIVATMCTMWGPGHALRGEDASYVDNAIYVLDKTKNQMERFFIFGLMCYFASSILVVCSLFDTRGRVTVCSIYGVVLIWMCFKISKIRKVLIPDKQSTGHLKFNRVKNIGELMGSDAKLHGGVSAHFASNI